MTKLPKKTLKLWNELMKKLHLLNMAINGEHRPAYDPEFYQQEIVRPKPHWFDKRAKPSRNGGLDSVIQQIMDSERNPALKAQAKRALKSYSVSRAKEIRSTPTRVIAGVRAAVTKRMKNA